MYAGRAVEMTDVRTLFRAPKHPYTRGLLNSVPKLGSSLAAATRQPLAEIGGTVPSLHQEIAGCAFAPRCNRATDICRAAAPPSEEKSPAHFAACHHPLDASTIVGAA
jgi:peptide/nickel transport system ATP-binding protein